MLVVLGYLGVEKKREEMPDNPIDKRISQEYSDLLDEDSGPDGLLKYIQELALVLEMDRDGPNSSRS